MPFRMIGRAAWKKNLVAIGPEPAGREGASCREPAKTVGQAVGEMAQIVEGDNMVIVGGDKQVSVVTRQRPQLREMRINEAAYDSDKR
jgi:hypothetical protein